MVAAPSRLPNGNSAVGRFAMKLHALLFLFLSSVTISSAHADAAGLDGRWRGTYNPGSEPAIELQFDESDGLYRGYVGAAQSGTSFPVERLVPGQAIRFVVPNLGIFQGRLHGDVLEGTFTGAAGTGSFHLDRGPEPDFQFVD
jgi:hypothetical protein